MLAISPAVEGRMSFDQHQAEKVRAVRSTALVLRLA
jgi:hypothetical protein